jgi:hypothetical protein
MPEARASTSETPAQACDVPATTARGVALTAAPAAAYARVLTTGRGRAGAVAPVDMLQLQRTVGNRAALAAVGRARLLQREAKAEGTPGNRPNLVAGDTGPAVTLLQSRLIRYVSNDNAIPLRLSGVVDADTLEMLKLFGTQYTVSSAVPDVWATIDELESLRGETIPTTKSFDDLSDEHKAKVAAIVNRHMDLSYARSHRPGVSAMDLRGHLIRARNSVSGERNAPGSFSLNITLRDAQRYLYGRLAPYTDPVALKRWAGAGVESASHDEVFLNDPSRDHIRGTITATEEYEAAKAKVDVRATDKPASALGGIPYFNKGIADSAKDTTADRWKKDLAPDHMDTSNIGPCPAEGEGAFPCGGAAGSEEA